MKTKEKTTAFWLECGIKMVTFYSFMMSVPRQKTHSTYSILAERTVHTAEIIETAVYNKVK